MGTPEQYFEHQFAHFIKQLGDLVRIPSVSFDGFPPEPVRQSANAVAQLLKEVGLENVKILEVPGAHPYVYADWLHAKDRPTLLLYAHHDVQPPGRVDLWHSPPFEPTERDGRLFGRGSADDKAGILVHTSAIASFLKTEGKLPLNVRLLIEGEEEIGSGHLEGFLARYKDLMKADAIVLTDTANFDTGIPTITTSLRGIVVMEVEVKAGERPLHSGMWGGPFPDPVLALSKMLASLVDEWGRIAVPGIYDDVKPLTPVEASSLEKLNYDDEQYRQQTGMLKGTQIVGGPASPLLKMSRLPSLGINAIQASSRKDAANIINETAWCRLGVRTVPNMDPAITRRQLEDFLRENAPWGVQVTFKGEQTGNWWTTNPEGVAFEKAAAALTKAFARDCIFLGCGGSIPFVGPFASVLGGVPSLLIGVEDPYTNAHAENESLHLGDFKKSILAAIYLYRSFAEGLR